MESEQQHENWNRRTVMTRSSSSCSSSTSNSRHIANVANYKADEGKMKASFKWIVSRVYCDSYVPDGLRSLFFQDNDGNLQLSPPLVASLANGSLYGQAASRIFRDAAIASTVHCQHGAVFSALSREGIDVRDAEGNAIMEETLKQSNPFNTNAHLHMVDALMNAHLRFLVSTDKIVHAISNYTSVEKREEPLDCVEALLFWINKVCLLVRDDIEHNGLSDVDDELPTIPEMEDLYEDLCDGTCICALISFYRPDELPLREICFNDPMSVNDCRFNLELLRFCSSSLPWNPFHFEAEDILYLHESLQPNINVFLADLFQFFESHSLVQSAAEPAPTLQRRFVPIHSIPDLRAQDIAYYKKGKLDTMQTMGNRPRLGNILDRASSLASEDSLATNTTLQTKDSLSANTPRRTNNLDPDAPNVTHFAAFNKESHSSPNGQQQQLTPQQKQRPLKNMTEIRLQMEEMRRQLAQRQQMEMAKQEQRRCETGKDAFFKVMSKSANNDLPQAHSTPKTDTPTSRLDPQLNLNKDLTNLNQMTYTDGDRAHNQRKTDMQQFTPSHQQMGGYQQHQQLTPHQQQQHYIPSPFPPTINNAQMFTHSDAFSVLPPQQNQLCGHQTSFSSLQNHLYGNALHQPFPSNHTPQLYGNALQQPFTPHQNQLYGGALLQQGEPSATSIRLHQANVQQFTPNHQQMSYQQHQQLTPHQQHSIPSAFLSPINSAQMFPHSDAFSVPSPFTPHQNQLYGGALQLQDESSATSFRLHQANAPISRLDPQLDLHKDLTNWSQMTYRDGDRPQRKTWVQKQTEANKSNPTLNISSSCVNDSPSVEGRTIGTRLALSGDGLPTESLQRDQQSTLNQTYTKSKDDSVTLMSSPPPAVVANGSDSANNRSGGLVLEDATDPNSEMTAEMQAKRRAILASQIRRKERIVARSEEKETEEMDRLQVKMQRMEQAETRRMEREQRRQKLLEDYKRKKMEQELMLEPGSARTLASSTISLNRGQSQPPPFGRPKSQSNMNLANVGGTLNKRACRAQSNMGNNNGANAEQNGGGGSSTARAAAPFSSTTEPSLKLFAKQQPKSNRGLIMNALQYSIFPGHVSNDQRQKAQAAIAQSDSKHFLVLFRDHQCQYRGLYTWDQFSDTVRKIEGFGPKICKEPMMTIMFKYDSGLKSFGQIPTKHLSATIDGFVIADQYWQKPKIPYSNR